MNNMDNTGPDLINQALHAPIEDLALIESHIKLVSSTQNWTDVAILIDEDIQNTLSLMLEKNQVISILRTCLTTDDSVSAINTLRHSKGYIYFGCYQGETLTQEQIHSISTINDIWNKITEQIVEYSLDDVRIIFQRIEEKSKDTGRGAAFNVETKRKVMLDSHGRCMFEGCGENIGIEDLTGTEGNYSYLAHNIASSENGARGTIGLSSELSNEPSNILLLCDKHHRLIDKVASADYPAHRLSEMRREFCSTANEFLDGLSYQPIPAFAVLWPVHRQAISAPSSMQIAQSLAAIRCRLHSKLNDISDNEAILRETDPKIAHEILLHSITSTAERILNQAHTSRYRAALFAFGLMPYLIALGAKLGNKNNITPMLKFRDSGQWAWPDDKPNGEFYSIYGLDNLSNNENEILLTLALTNEPESLKNSREIVANSIDAKQVIIKANPDTMGNGALGHPEDGYAFTNSMQILMHELKGKNGINKIHLFPCASNAACVFFGQAFDSYHPDILIYDFIEQSMEPSIFITNKSNKCEIALP